MSTWPRYPIIYLINTWVWLQELGRNNKGPGNPCHGSEGRMGRYRRSRVRCRLVHGGLGAEPCRIDVSMQNPGLLTDFHRALPGFVAADNVGSPYCVRNYVVDPHLGGPKVWQSPAMNSPGGGCA